MSDETSGGDGGSTEGSAPTRIGIGHELHRLVDGARLVLGGVEIPAERGFATHSDGDVLSHALVDALAGALADGDLGTHFPEDDPEAEDARSLDFVEEFGAHVRDAGFDVIHVDSFVVLGTTRLRPHIEAMRTNLATALPHRPRTRLGEGPLQRRHRPRGRGRRRFCLGSRPPGTSPKSIRTTARHRSIARRADHLDIATRSS